MSVWASNQITPPGPPWQLARPDGPHHLTRKLLAGRLDRMPVARLGIALVERLGQARVHIAVVVDHVSERAHLLAQLGVTDRRRAHVDPAPAGPKSECRTDDGDAARGIGGVGHGLQAYPSRRVRGRG
jgi:hypothetical protein